MEKMPCYWKTGISDVETAVKNLKKADEIKTRFSAGGRPIQMIFFGKKNNLNRTANLSSALGARDKSCYADKSGEDYRPTILLVGCIHGGEFEGTAALLNLLSIIETGVDLNGEKHEFLHTASERVNLIVIPMINPDGRARVKFDSMVGKTYEELRYYNQGTWKDGSLCEWPECKKVHPIKEHCKFLGGYFNDDGVNLMHDDFFGVKATETQFLFDIVDEYCPDFTILLHGGLNTPSAILKPEYAPESVKRDILKLEEILKERCEAQNLGYAVTGMNREENANVPSSFNLISALYHFSGEPCVTFESNQGISGIQRKAFTHEEIYTSHIILFEETIKHIEERKEGENEK